MNGALCTLTGKPLDPPTKASYHHLCHLLHSDGIAEFHTISFSALSQTSTPSATFLQLSDLSTRPPTMDSSLWAVLQNYAPVFAQPHGLHPSRPQDHHITLLPNTHPIYVKHYRYSHSQKETMYTI